MNSKVLLINILDSFSVHAISKCQCIMNVGFLSFFLVYNVISQHQPPDQGAIRTWKVACWKHK